MFFIDLFLACTIALFFTVVIALGFGRPGTMTTYILLFVLLMLSILAGTSWMVPREIPMHGYYWFSFFIVGLIVSLLMLALVPALRQSRKLTEAQEEKRREAVSILAFDFFFGSLVLVLVAVIALSYI